VASLLMCGNTTSFHRLVRASTMCPRRVLRRIRGIRRSCTWLAASQGIHRARLRARLDDFLHVDPVLPYQLAGDSAADTRMRRAGSTRPRGSSPCAALVAGDQVVQPAAAVVSASCPSSLPRVRRAPDTRSEGGVGWPSCVPAPPGPATIASETLYLTPRIRDPEQCGPPLEALIS